MISGGQFHILLYKSSTLIELLGLYDVALTTDPNNPVWLNGAAVSVRLVGRDGNVSGETWPLTVPYVAASNGNYRATLKATLGVKQGDKLTAVIDVDAGSDKVGHWEEPVIVKVR